MKIGLKIKLSLLILGIFFIIGSETLSEDFYKWIDENGIIHFSDSSAGIPPQFRENTLKESFEEQEKEKKKQRKEEKKTEELLLLEALQKEDKPQTFEIPYDPYEGMARRIIIPVTFNESVTAPMVLDTGAPGLIISPELAEELGLMDEDATKLIVNAGGIGGSVPAIRTIIDTVEVGGAKDHFIPTTVVSSISDSFEGLVGMDFMSNYSIRIDPRKHVMVFEEVPQDPNSPGGHDEVWWRTNFTTFGAFRDAWKEYKEKIDRDVGNSIAVSNMTKKLRGFAGDQFKAAEQLYDKLNRYAIQHAVPLSWRKY
ncbi:MAG TPA: retropepsin-like aspartic protease [Nitrospiria bacterium]|jgi:predicted aspartyl protease